MRETGQALQNICTTLEYFISSWKALGAVEIKSLLEILSPSSRLLAQFLYRLLCYCEHLCRSLRQEYRRARQSDLDAKKHLQVISKRLFCN